jgi:lipoprotein-releasing system permease protein
MLMPEAFIAWRYLYRRRRGRILPLMTLLSALALGATEVAYFGFGHHALPALLTIPAALATIICLLLNAFSVFTTVSIFGIVLGVSALTVVLSVSSGFEEAFHDKVLGVNAHVLVMKYGRDFSEYRDVQRKIEADPEVRAASPFIFSTMLVSRGDVAVGVILKGIDPVASLKVLDIESSLQKGSNIADLTRVDRPNDGGPPAGSIFLGETLAKKLHVKIGDRVQIVAPRLSQDTWLEGDTDRGSPSSRDFRVAGMFASGFDEYDRRLVYVSLAEAQALHGAGDIVDGVEMKIKHISDGKIVAARLLKMLGGLPYKVTDWEGLNHNMFTALATQKKLLVIVLTLIVIVAAFNVVAAMTMLVVEKTKEIAILRSMGLSAGRLASVFLFAGLVIGGIGTAIGQLLGLLCVTIVARYNYALDAKVYLIDRLPVEINPMEMLLIVGITLTICLLATLYPAFKSARLLPADGLRYE